MLNQSANSMIWTFLPGLHGTQALYESVRHNLPQGIDAEFINLPSKGKQDYNTLANLLHQELSNSSEGSKRLLIAESFSGPLAIRIASLCPEKIQGIVLGASFCDAPLNPGIALIPLRPLFMVKPPRSALRHFLIGDDASKAELAELREVMQSVPSATLSKRIRTILELEEDDNPDLPDIPMLILQAKKDNLVPWQAQSKLEVNYPKATTHWIESPHLIFQRCPEECVQRIIEFADTINPALPAE